MIGSVSYVGMNVRVCYMRSGSDLCMIIRHGQTVGGSLKEILG